MSANPMTKRAWLAYLKKAIDDFDWEAAGQEREWVGLTDEEIDQGQKESWVTKQAWESAVWWAEAKLKEKNT